MPIADEAKPDATTWGWILVVAAALATAFAMAHPSISASDLPGVLRQLSDGATFNGWIHGVLIALYVVLVAGFWGLSRRLGTERPVVAMAMAAYALGVVAMMGAAVINGFALGIFAGRYAEIQPAQFAAVGAAINAMGSIAATWAGIGAVATSAAIALWSLRLVALPGASRVIGGLGILLGLVTMAMLIAGVLILDVHGFLLLVVSQTAWTIAVGVQLIRGRL